MIIPHEQPRDAQRHVGHHRHRRLLPEPTPEMSYSCSVPRMLTMRAGVQRLYTHLPAPAQDAARGLLERRAAKRATNDLAGSLTLVDAGIDGFDGKRVVEIGSDHAAATL